ncbi:MAG: cobyrinate a,c-diamide synthase [Thermoplasmata archaeon]|jgi:cobyrinic acid a,c-diamide synthase
MTDPSSHPPGSEENAVLTVPRLVVSSYKGKGGKTLATMAILSALSRQGLKVCAFKNGPDFIDPSYHRAVLGTPSRNLDYVLMGPTVLERFYRYSLGYDVAVVEGNHGLYDSMDGRTEVGSTAQMAKLLGAPVVVVLDGERLNRTVGALVRGLTQFDPAVRLRGAILTNVVPRQFDRLTAIVEAEGLPVLGILPRSEEVARGMEYRHLGLTPMEERRSGGLVDLVREQLSPRVDAAQLIRVAREGSESLPLRVPETPPAKATGTARIGVVGGRPFTFYYPEMLERASQLGTVVFIDPETDATLPPLDLLLIGGGFPELYAEALERNRSLRSSVRQFAEQGGRVYAECGGLMYLTDSIVTSDGEFDMVGVIEGVTVHSKRPAAHGYATARVLRDIPIARAGTVLRGHEFHYSRVLLRRKYELALAYDQGQGLSDRQDGIQVNNVYAHYLHLHPANYDVLSALLPSG